MKTNEPIRILVFGETGTGKTSLCNALSGQKMPTSDRAVGVTFHSQNYLPFTRHDCPFILTDTVGLNEGDKGTVTATEAFKNLLELVRKSENGYNIFIQVAHQKITKSLCDNYKFFVETVAQKKIPVILVVTGCENIEPMSLWEEQNRHYYEEQGFDYKNILATCFAETVIPDFKPRFDGLRLESKIKVLSTIEQYALEEPYKLYEQNNGFISLLKRIWNGFCDYIEAENWKITISKTLLNLLLRIGFNEKEAKELAEKWSLKEKE